MIQNEKIEKIKEDKKEEKIQEKEGEITTEK